MTLKQTRIEVNNAVFSLPYHVAREEGYFAVEGYEVELVPAGFEATAPWVGLIAPAGTPGPVVNRLNEEINKSLAKPESKERLKALGVVTVGGSPADFAEFLKKDWERWSRVIKAAGVKVE